jgi:hypothetical protein
MFPEQFSARLQMDELKVSGDRRKNKENYS